MAVPPARPRCRTYDFPSASGRFGLNLPWGHTPSVFEHGRWEIPTLHQSLPDLLRNPIEPDLALHQGVLEPSPELSPEPC